MALRRRAAGGAGTTWSRWGWVRGKTAADAEKPASVRAAKWPFTHSYSPRDNYFEHRIFLPNPLELAVAAPVFNLPTTV